MEKKTYALWAMFLIIFCALATTALAQNNDDNPAGLVADLLEMRADGATNEELSAYAEGVIDDSDNEDGAVLASHEEEYYSFPPGDPDGDGLNVSDVLTALRWSVGLYDYYYDERGARDERYAYDVAPTATVGEWQSCQTCDGLEYVENTYALGDGDLDVADVLVLLRASVDLQDLNWPRRELQYYYEGGSWARPFDGYHIMWNFEQRHLGLPLAWDNEIEEHTGIALRTTQSDQDYYSPRLNQIVLFDGTVPIVQVQTFPVSYEDTLLGTLKYTGPHMWGRQIYHSLELAGPRQDDEFEGTESFWGNLKYTLLDYSMNGEFIQERVIYGGGKG